MWKTAAIIILIAAAGLHGQTPDCGPVRLIAPAVQRGAPLQVKIDPAPPDGKGTIELARANEGPRTAPVQVTGGIASYTIPDDLPLGSFAVAVTLDKKYPACPVLKVMPRLGGGQLKLTSLDPPGTRREGDFVNFALRGSGFDTGRPDDNQILINGKAQEVDWTQCKDDTPSGRVTSADRIDLCHIPVGSANELALRIKQGDQVSDLQRFELYSVWSSTWAVAIVSALVSHLMGLFVLALIKLLQRAQQASGTTHSVLETLFVDPETETYSLSKFQFYLWTAAAVFGYCYLVISRILVQRQQWPEIPDGLPAIIGLAAGTSIGAQFVTNVRGPKGAGGELPSFGDLVTSGGVAAPERVQFFVWTIIGVAVFCVAVVQHSPDLIKGIDPVPTSMMTMMGLSSLGYLGGKLARKPGPIVNEISIVPSESDDDMASAAATPQGPPDLSQAAAKAKGVLDTFTDVPPGNAKTAVDALNGAVTAAGQVKTARDGVAVTAKLGELQSKAEAAAAAAAAEFATPGAQPAARQAAEMAQRAVSALQELTASVTSLVAASVAPPLPGGAGPAFTRMIEIRGQNLSSEGLFEIDGQELPFRMLVEKDGKRLPEVVIREQDDPTLARVLRLSIDPAQLEASDFRTYKKWFGSSDPKTPKTFSVINPDGQKSDITFTVPPAAAQNPTKTGQPPAGGK